MIVCILITKGLEIAYPLTRWGTLSQAPWPTLPPPPPQASIPGYVIAKIVISNGVCMLLRLSMIDRWNKRRQMNVRSVFCCWNSICDGDNQVNTLSMSSKVHRVDWKHFVGCSASVARPNASPSPCLSVCPVAGRPPWVDQATAWSPCSAPSSSRCRPPECDWMLPAAGAATCITQLRHGCTRSCCSRNRSVTIVTKFWTPRLAETVQYK